MATSLSLLWGLINALQLITHFPFCEIEQPDNVDMSVLKIYELVNFDLIPTDWAENYVNEQVGAADKTEEMLE